MPPEDALAPGNSACASTDTSTLATEVSKGPRVMDPLYEKKSEYRKLVKLMRGAKWRSFDANRFPWQTRIIIDELLDLAVETRAHVEIFKGMSTRTFYGKGLHERCRKLVQREGTARVIFAEHDETDSFWRELRDEFKDRLQVLAMDEHDPDLYHYCLVQGPDGQQEEWAYRLEFPHPRWEGGVTDLAPERPARFSFNDPELARRIKKYSAELAQIAKPL